MKESNALAMIGRTVGMLAGFDWGDVVGSEASPGEASRGAIPEVVSVAREAAPRQIQAMLDLAYLLGNLGGWFSERQDQCFEIIAAGLGKKPADVSPDAVGLNAKLAHLRGKVSAEVLLETFLTGTSADCEALAGGGGFPIRHAFAVWLALGFADGEMDPLCRAAVERLGRRFRRLGAVSAVSEAFLHRAGSLMQEAAELESRIADERDPKRRRGLQEERRARFRDLRDLITSSAPEREVENEKAAT